jgi:methionyl-tRNA formyltransferase
MKITLFLLGEKGLISLQSLNKNATDTIEKVVIGTDKNVRNDYSIAIQHWCEKMNILYTFDDTKAISSYLITIGWRKMIVIDAHQKLIVLHDSLLPKYRGFNPLVTALINGDKTIGVTALFGTKEYDKGDIIAQESLSISYPISIQEAITKIATCYATLLNIVFMKIKDDTLSAVPQDQEKATYSLWRDHEDYFIDWNASAKKIIRFIDAVGYPYDGAKFRINDQVYKVLKAHETTDVKIENRTPGKVIFKENEKIYVVCKKGIVCLTQVVNDQNELQKFESKFRLRLH